MSDVRSAMAERKARTQPERDAIVSQPEGRDVQAAQQMTLRPGDVRVDKAGALQLHFDDSEDLMVSIRRGIQALEKAGVQDPAGKGGSGDGSDIRVLLYTPHRGPTALGGDTAQASAPQQGAGKAGRPPAAMQNKVGRFSRRLEEVLSLLDRSGVAPETLRIFLGSEWFRDEAGNTWSREEQDMAVQLLCDVTAPLMNVYVDTGRVQWAASPWGATAAADEQP